jgi:hypothetical protein
MSRSLRSALRGGLLNEHTHVSSHSRTNQSRPSRQDTDPGDQHSDHLDSDRSHLGSLLSCGPLTRCRTHAAGLIIPLVESILYSQRCCLYACGCGGRARQRLLIGPPVACTGLGELLRA